MMDVCGHSLTRSSSHIPTGARAPGKFRMITVGKAEGRLAAPLLGLCSSLPFLFFFQFLLGFLGAAQLFTYAY